MWSGTTYQALLASKTPELLRYQVNKEGTPVGSDTMMMLKNAPHPNTAMLFIDWMLRPENSVQNVGVIGYPMMTTAGLKTYSGLTKKYPWLKITTAEVRRVCTSSRSRARRCSSGTPPGPRSRPRQGHVPVRRGLWSAFLVPPGLWLVALYLIPLGLIVAASFGSVDFLGRVIYAWPFAGWDLSNYDTVLSDTYLPAFFRSLGFAALTTLLCLLIGYPVAYVIARYGGRVRHLLVVLLVIPWFVDYLIRVYAWIVLLGDNGVVNGWLGDLGMSGDPPIQFLGTWWAVVGGLFYSYFPFMVLPVYAAVERMDSSLVEAGKDLYGTPWQTFRHVTFPATFQGVVAGAVLVFLPASGDFANAEFLGSPATSMIGNVINGTFNQGGYVPLGGTLTVCFMVGIAAFMVFYLRSAARASREGAM